MKSNENSCKKTSDDYENYLSLWSAVIQGSVNVIFKNAKAINRLIHPLTAPDVDTIEKYKNWERAEETRLSKLSKALRELNYELNVIFNDECQLKGGISAACILDLLGGRTCIRRGMKAGLEKIGGYSWDKMKLALEGCK